MYCLPEKHLVTDRDFIAELKKACPQVDIKAGPPNYGDIESTSLPKLLILDDLLITLNANLLEALFTQHSHHARYSMFQLVYNLMTLLVPDVSLQRFSL